MSGKLPIFPGPSSETEDLEYWEESVRNALPKSLYDSVKEFYDEEEFLRYLRIIDESFRPEDLMTYSIEVDTLGLIPSIQQLRNIATSMKGSTLRLNGFEIDWDTDSIEDDIVTQSYGARQDFWRCEIKIVGPQMVEEIDPETKEISSGGTETFGKASFTLEEYNAKLKQGLFYKDFSEAIKLLINACYFNGLSLKFPIKLTLSRGHIIRHDVQIEPAPGLVLDIQTKASIVITAGDSKISPKLIEYGNDLSRLIYMAGERRSTYRVEALDILEKIENIISSDDEVFGIIYAYNLLVMTVVKSKSNNIRIKAAQILGNFPDLDTADYDYPMTSLAIPVISSAIYTSNSDNENGAIKAVVYRRRSIRRGVSFHS